LEDAIASPLQQSGLQHTSCNSVRIQARNCPKTSMSLPKKGALVVGRRVCEVRLLVGHDCRGVMCFGDCELQVEARGGNNNNFGPG
jgi:hypothetical protein